MLPFLHLGPLALPTYGLLAAAGLITADFVLRADLRRRHLAAEAETIIGIAGIAGVIGAKLYHLLESPREFFAHPLELFFSRTGLAWFGALLAGFVTLLALARYFKMADLEMLDLASPAAALGYGVGRIGCLTSGDGDYGIPTSLPWGMSFPNGLVPTTDRVHPTPIYEFLVAILIFWILWRLGARDIAAQSEEAHAKKKKAATAIRYGRVFACYLVLSGLARFLVEFIRINPRSFLGLTNAQLMSVLSIAAGAALFWHVRGPAAGAQPGRSPGR